ncbi:MAG: hypothetical protein H8E44_13440 [Planctomycetes bacterium]|nr:hypothetical protein [Planctomycetota bacterium]MBL7039139.1 hypothetical protein [Pirellulaceae bacterium]
MNSNKAVAAPRFLGKTYDPGLAELCEEVLGDSEWRFVSPHQCAGAGHLKGYDPTAAPKVVGPEHIQEAANDYYDEYWKDFWQRLRDKHNSEFFGSLR